MWQFIDLPGLKTVSRQRTEEPDIYPCPLSSAPKGYILANVLSYLGLKQNVGLGKGRTYWEMELNSECACYFCANGLCNLDTGFTEVHSVCPKDGNVASVG